MRALIGTVSCSNKTVAGVLALRIEDRVSHCAVNDAIDSDVSKDLCE